MHAPTLAGLRRGEARGVRSVRHLLASPLHAGQRAQCGSNGLQGRAQIALVAAAGERLHAGRQAGQERLDQSRLADPRLALDRDDAPFAREGRREALAQLRELRVPTDERRRAPRHGHASCLARARCDARCDRRSDRWCSRRRGGRFGAWGRIAFGVGRPSCRHQRLVQLSRRPVGLDAHLGVQIAGVPREEPLGVDRTVRGRQAAHAASDRALVQRIDVQQR